MLCRCTFFCSSFFPQLFQFGLNVGLAKIKKFKVIEGVGVQGNVDGHFVQVGSEKLLENKKPPESGN